MCVCVSILERDIYSVSCNMGWLRLVGSLKLLVSFAKEPYKRDDIHMNQGDELCLDVSCLMCRVMWGGYE